MGAMGADFGPEHPTLVAIGASRSRLGATRGVDELLRRVSLQDNPMRVQGKIMSLVHADAHRGLARSLPDRQAVALHHQSMNPHWVSISASADPNLQLSDEPLASALAQRLSLTQKPIPSYTDIVTDSACPNCGLEHVSPYLEGAITCYRGGNPGRLRWHTTVNRTLYAMARSVGLEASIEPRSMAPPGQPQVRVDLSVHSMLDNADVHCDVRTYCASAPTTIATEAGFPGTLADLIEKEKTAKHLPVIKAHSQRDLFFPFAVSEHGSLGPQAHEFLDMVFARSASPGAAKTYWLRRLAVVTANATHDIYHRQLQRLPDSSGAAALPMDADLHGQVADPGGAVGAPDGGPRQTPTLARAGIEAAGAPVTPPGCRCAGGPACDACVTCAQRGPMALGDPIEATLHAGAAAGLGVVTPPCPQEPAGAGAGGGVTDPAPPPMNDEEEHGGLRDDEGMEAGPGRLAVAPGHIGAGRGQREIETYVKVLQFCS